MLLIILEMICFYCNCSARDSVMRYHMDEAKDMTEQMNRHVSYGDLILLLLYMSIFQKQITKFVMI